MQQQQDGTDVVFEGRDVETLLKRAHEQSDAQAYIRAKLTEQIDGQFVVAAVWFFDGDKDYSEKTWARIAAARAEVLEALGIAKDSSILLRCHTSTNYPQFFHDYRVGSGVTWLYDHHEGTLKPRVNRELTVEEIGPEYGQPLEATIAWWREHGHPNWTGNTVEEKEVAR